VSALQIVTVVGNPRPGSRTHTLARTLADELAAVLPDAKVSDVDLAVLGAGVLDPSDADVTSAVKRVLGADILILASPTYKATYSGLLKAFLDRLGTGSLAGRRAVPILLGGAPNHQLAVDVHFTPLLLELGASVPVRGLFVLEADVPAFGAFAASWAAQHAPALAAG
jgi:FMN reductase